MATDGTDESRRTPGVEEGLLALNVEAPVAELLRATLRLYPALLYPTKAKHCLAFVPEDGAQIAVYVERRIFSVALASERAQVCADEFGVSVLRRPHPTWYVRASVEQLADPLVRQQMQDAAHEALELCRSRYVGEKRAGRITARPNPDSCQLCKLSLLPTGACGTEACAANSDG